ncbi:Alpha/Beta hydrolase protein [Roridomyces roridus]|uniref:Carboxylic ester hydrolase n=1 Tax=Roridomyces roridus TaxID=1738132 RepID=A0AAD7FPA8_9AGAR|nr:Alpha/Beta hydrolase protein [Roridomyces roridus]
MRSFFALAALVSACFAAPTVVNTTSGVLHGSTTDGVTSFKGIPFAQPPTGALRWEPPVPFISAATQNVTTLGPSCLQQFAFATAAFDEFLFNNPPPAENEDCLFLNVWAPASSAKNLEVLVWIYGGSLAFGTASLPTYDGTSMVANQGIIFVSFNYRTNVFGFPGSPDLPLTGNNLGFLDQELAFKWVQQNIAQFGGDPTKVTIMGQSAGSQSVSAAINRHSVIDAPFRAGIMLSGAVVSMLATPSFTSFNNFSASVGCNQAVGPARLACLKQVPAATIRSFTNGPTSGAFEPVVDGVTVFADPLGRIRSGLTARVPFIIGNMQNDGTVFAFGLTDLTAFLQVETGGLITAAEVRPLYPGLNDSTIIAEIIKDVAFLCPAELWSTAAVGVGLPNVFRYSYGAVFADLQLFPGAGAWHSSELPGIFGTLNKTSATAAEITLSGTMQTIVGNFVKNPTQAPAPNWPRWIPGALTNTLAKLAYNGNVEASNVVQAVQSDSIDGPCNALWNAVLDPIV